MKIAWIYLDKRGAAIDALKDYAAMAYIIENHADDLEETRAVATNPPSSAMTGMPGRHNPQAYETRLAASLDEIDVLKERYRRALEYMEWFQPAWEALTDEEQFLLNECFVREDINKTEAVGNVSDKLHIERTHVYRRKGKAIDHLALMLYGK